ncbi:MAG: hypothetical protein E2O29_01980 [Deltaproteobacteria bacterium]|nr:MAG: hypothetical protein E2O29_01980 [Deltaproteobacteria bacterium]
MSKIYSVIIKGYRIDVTEEQLNTIRKGTTVTDGGRRFVHLFVKNESVSILKEEFEKAIEKRNIMLGDGKMVVLVTDDIEGKYQCVTCSMYIPETGECTNVLGHIEPEGTCQLRMTGPNAKPSQTNPFRLLKEEAGYDERDEGFGCIRCIRFQQPSTCKIITDDVDWNNCCNYQYDGNAIKSSAISSKYAEEQEMLSNERLKTTGGDRVALEQKIRETKKTMLTRKDEIRKNDPKEPKKEEKKEEEEYQQPETDEKV